MAIGDAFGSNYDPVNGLDGGNPLHMNPNDSTSTSLIPFKLLGTENYRVWSSAMKLALHARNKCNPVVLTWIMNSVSADVYMGLVYSVDAATLWKDLKSTYDKFDALTKLPICVFDANKELDTHNKLIKLMKFLIGLDDCYQSTRSSLLIQEPLPEVKDSYAIVSREESHRGIPESSSVTEAKINATSFAAKSIYLGLKKVTNLIKQTGRFKQNFNANVDVKSNDKQQSARSQNSSSSSFTLEEMKKLLSLINETSSGSIHANMAGHPNGTLATVSHVGNLQLTKIVVLYDVLVVPGYCVSLLSMNKMIKDSKLFVGFDEEKCYIQDLKKEIILGTGSESGGLYLLDLKSDRNIGNVNMVHAFNVSKSLWHSRLGHPADQVLVVLKKELSLSKSTNVSACEVCHRAKQTREPFPLSDHKSEKVGDLIHVDLWGLYRVTSREGFKYFLTIVDDFSRAVWVFLIKNKDEVFNEIFNFVKLVHNQFDTKIKVMRSDNGTEFVNKRLNAFYNDLGIIQQTSCVYTPSQNGIAERKHTHLLNVARSLMLPTSILNVTNLHLDREYKVFLAKLQYVNAQNCPELNIYGPGWWGMMDEFDIKPDQFFVFTLACRGEFNLTVFNKLGEALTDCENYAQPTCYEILRVISKRTRFTHCHTPKISEYNGNRGSVTS
ncbi:putative RNA-directed DNA polymerase [Tanacetum coccineum]